MKSLQFNSYAKQIDGEQYCSEVETLAENMIEGNVEDATIVYPSNNQFISFRSENWRITTDSLYMILPFPLYKIVSIKIKPNGLTIGNMDYTRWVNANGQPFIPDVTRFFLLQEEWISLPATSSEAGSVLGWNLAQSNTMTYSKNSSSIQILSTPIKRRPSQSTMPLYESMIISAFLNEEITSQYIGSDGYTLYNALNRYTWDRDSIDPRNWEYQIEYIPIPQSTKMKAHKAEKKPRKYAQIVNQRAEVNNAEAFGKYLHTMAQKTGTEKIAIAKTYTKIADVPPVGAVVWHNGEKYRLVANSWSVTNTVTFTVMHTLSKNWSSKSKHVAVDQKYRNWNIPFDDYVWRTVYYEEFIELSGNAVAFDSAFNSKLWENALKGLFSLGATDTVLQNMWLINRDNSGENGCVLPVSTQGIGKSLVFSASTKDTLSAGLRVDPTNSEYCEEVLYCNADGTMDEMSVILSPEIAAYDDLAYPYATLYNENRPPLFNGVRHFAETFALDKDPGEAIKVTIQCHFIPTENWIVVGNAMAKDHPFVSGKAKTGLKIWLLKDYIRDGVEKIIATAGADKDWYVPLETQELVNAFIECDGTSVRIKGTIESTKYKAWAITDMDNNLYLGSNDTTKQKIFINIRRNRT